MGINRHFGGRVWRALAHAAAAAMMCGLACPAAAQTVAPLAGLYIEIEVQAVSGGSDYSAAFIPSLLDPTQGDMARYDEGDGRGGALAVGFAWGNGWSGTVRFRRLEADDSHGPMVDPVFVFAAGDPFIPGGSVIPMTDATTRVTSETSMLDLEVARRFDVSGGYLQLFAGLTHVSIDRETALTSDGCGCLPITFTLTNQFEGTGPKFGFRGGIPLFGAIRLVGGVSVAALFGSAEFGSWLDDPIFPSLPFKSKDDRTVAALNAEGGVSIPVWTGTLTFGYRVDAIRDALDTDQRVSVLFTSLGFPGIGNKNDDFIEHGPFARLSVPFGAGGN